MPLTWIVEFSKDSRTGGLLCQPLPFCQSINGPSSMYASLIFKPDHFPRTIGTSELRSELKYVEALICSQGSRCSCSYLVDQRLDCKSWRLVRIRIERLLSIGLRLLRGFTLFWLFPVSLLVGLVSIQNISLFWPSLVCVSYILLEQETHS